MSFELRFVFSYPKNPRVPNLSPFNPRKNAYFKGLSREFHSNHGTFWILFGHIGSIILNYIFSSLDNYNQRPRKPLSIKFHPNQVTFCISVRRFKPFSTSSKADRASKPFEVLRPLSNSSNMSELYVSGSIKFDHVHAHPYPAVTVVWNFDLKKFRSTLSE